MAEYGISSIHVIESLGASFNEPGKQLIQRLKSKGGILGSIPISHHEAFGRDDVFRALSEIYTDEAKLGLAPILHFEAHGDAAGLELRDGSQILWGELADRLRAFNRATRFNLLAVFACCNGIHQILALTIYDMCPFSAVVGCEGTVYTSELLNGFERFYEILINNGKARRAESELQAAVTKSSGTKFKLFSCEYAFEQVYANVMRVNRDAGIRAQRIEHYRLQLDRFNALNGNLTPSSPAEIDRVLRETEAKTLRDFYTKFFAITEISENATRFPLKQMVARASAAANSTAA